MTFLALLCAGCKQAELEYMQHDRPPMATGGSSKMQREWDMNQQWQNRRFSDLQAKMGSPRLMLNIPGGGNPPGFVAVYGHDVVTGCIDAFAILPGVDPVVRVYHCR